MGFLAFLGTTGEAGTTSPSQLTHLEAALADVPNR